MPQEYDDAVKAPTADGVLQPILTALVQAPLGGTSVIACLLLDHCLTVVELGCQAHRLEPPTWLEERREDVTQALQAGVMRELLAAEEALRILEASAHGMPALRDRVAKLSSALGLPDRCATIVEDDRS